MSRRSRREGVRKLAKSVLKSKDSEVNVQLPKSSFNYFEKEIKKNGGKG